jgi:hypothetical protein
MLDWLIIGGGVHGTHLAAVLIGRVGIDPGGLAIIDPHRDGLAAWDRRAHAVGMEYLRSPGVHNLGLGPMDLITWADARPGWASSEPFMARYLRPSVPVFRAHADAVCSQHGLGLRRIVGTAERIRPWRRRWRVETTTGRLDARNVVLALGATGHTSRPDWAARLPPGRVSHVFDEEFRREDAPAGTHVVVVGGGISAAQVALSLAGSGGGPVTLLMRHRVRRHMFDSDPTWLGPVRMAEFLSDPDPASRRRTIAASRHRGSIPPELADLLATAVRRGRILVRRAEVADARVRGGAVALDLGSADPLVCDRVVLATGVDPARPGGELVDRVVRDLGLPVAPCGYPIVDPALRWCRGLHVTGPLAELELGPVARNIAGARRAADRLVLALSGAERLSPDGRMAGAPILSAR